MNSIKAIIVKNVVNERLVVTSEATNLHENEFHEILPVFEDVGHTYDGDNTPTGTTTHLYYHCITHHYVTPNHNRREKIVKKVNSDYVVAIEYF